MEDVLFHEPTYLPLKEGATPWKMNVLSHDGSAQCLSCHNGDGDDISRRLHQQSINRLEQFIDSTFIPAVYQDRSYTVFHLLLFSFHIFFTLVLTILVYKCLKQTLPSYKY